MIYKILDRLQKDSVDAHCDIPCGIYDPITAQIAALTVVRMIDVMNGAVEDGGTSLAAQNTVGRAVTVKEEHAEKAKHEIRVIWGDFIKDAHLETYPQLHGLVHKIMQLGSKSRQGVDREAAVQFVEAINEFAEIFWAIKGVGTKKAKAPYAPGLELVYPDL